MDEQYAGVVRSRTVYIAVPSSLRQWEICIELELTGGRRVSIHDVSVRESEEAAEYFEAGEDGFLSNSLFLSFELPKLRVPLCGMLIWKKSSNGVIERLSPIGGYSLATLYPVEKRDREIAFTSSASRHRDVSTLMFILEQQHTFPAGDMGYVNNARVVYSYRALEMGCHNLLRKSLDFLDCGLKEARKFPDTSHVRNGRTSSKLSLIMAKLHILIFMDDLVSAKKTASSMVSYMSDIQEYQTSFAYNHVKILLIDMLLDIKKSQNCANALKSIERVKSSFALAASKVLKNREANKIRELGHVSGTVSSAMRFGRKIEVDNYFCPKITRELAERAFRSRQEVLARKLIGEFADSTGASGP